MSPIYAAFESRQEDAVTDPILFWNEVALKAHKRDFMFDDEVGDDEASAPMNRQALIPKQDGPTPKGEVQARSGLFTEVKSACEISTNNHSDEKTSNYVGC